MINFNLEEAKEKTIEYLNKKAYSLIRPNFTKYSGVYSFTTENLSYLKKINILDKDILTVTGSFDHCLNLVCLGAKSITNFDVNLLTVCYGYLKYAALKNFSFYAP